MAMTTKPGTTSAPNLPRPVSENGGAAPPLRISAETSAEPVVGSQAVPSLSVVIPVYNSELILPELLAVLAGQLPRCATIFEVVLVNDGSRDDSARVIKRLTDEYGFVRGIELSRNYGQHNALLAGIRAAKHDTIVTMDDDLQHPPEEIPKLLAKLNEGVDVVYGVPEREQHGLLRDMASQVTKLALQKAMGAETARRISAFRAFRTHLRGAFDQYHNSFVSIDVLLTWGTTRFTGIQVRHNKRKVGVSNYTVRKLLTHALNLITGFSVLPLQLASMVGFGCTAFGVLLLGYVLYNYFILEGRVPGFTFVVSAIAIFSGAQLFALGIIGEYLARAHFRLMDKPSYAIRPDGKGDASGGGRDRERTRHDPRQDDRRPALEPPSS